MKNKFSKFINLQGKYLTSLLILLAMSIGNVWGDTFSAADIVYNNGAGKTKSNVTVSSGKTSTISTAKIKNVSNQTAVQIGNNVDTATYTSTEWIQIQADANYTLDNTLSITGASTSSTSGKEMAAVLWKGAYSATAADSIIVVSLPVNNSTTDDKLSFTFPSGRFRTIRLVKRINYKDGTIGKGANGNSYRIPSNAQNFNVSTIVATATASTETPVCPETLTITSKDNKTAFTEGDKVELTAALAKGNGTITYQWYKGSVASGNEISGATTNKLTINSCTTSDAGDYFCAASKSGCETPAQNSSAFTISVAADPKCFNMPAITSTPSNLASISVTGGSLADVGDGKTLKMQSTGIGFGNGNAARLKVTLTDASIVEGTKITINYNNASSDGSGIGLYNENYEHQVIGTTGVTGSGTVTHTFTAAEAAYYADEFLIDRNQTGKGIIVGSITVEDCGPAVTRYAVTLDYNDGVTANGSLSVVEGNAAVKPADPTRGKYTFLGWFVGDTDNEYVWSTPVTAPITLKAHWQDPWTITFDADGGSAVADITVKHNTAADKPTDPTKDDNDFLGWYNGENAYDWTAVVTGNLNLKAHWAPIVAKYDVEYYDGETKIGTELQVWANLHPTATGINTYKPLYTFVGWYTASNLEGDPVDLNTVTPVDGLKLYGKWTKAYASNADFEAYIIANTSEKDDSVKADTYVKSLNYALSKKLGTTFDANTSSNNGAYAGLKIKNAGTVLSWNVVAGKVVELKAGVMVANGSLAINGGTPATIDGGSTTSGNDNFKNHYFYSATEALYEFTTSNGSAEVIKAITMRDPYEVSFDANGGDDVAALYGIPAVTLPLPTNGTQNFAGWYDALDNFIGNAGASYTPTANIELVAKWEALSTVNTLSDLKVDGVTVDGFSEDVHTYYIVVPYGTAIANLPKITAATPTNANASVAIWPAAPAWTDDFGGCYRQQANVTPQDPNAAVGYNDIRITIAPKDGVVIIHADIPSGTSADYAATGLYAGTGTSKNEGSSLKLGANHYAGVTLSGGEIFKEGDILNVHVKTINGFVKAPISTTNAVDGSGVIFTEERSFVVGDNFITLTSAFEEANSSSLYLVRTTAVDAACNPAVDYIEVTRAMNPVLTAITLDGVAAEPGVGNTFSATLPNGTNLASMTVTPTIVWNGAGTAEPTSAWAWGDNTFRVTDKDGDYTDYTITLTEAASPSAAPVITTQPVGDDYIEGATIAALEVAATGSGELSYQWYLGADAIDGATAATYTPTVSAIGSYVYHCVVTNTEAGHPATSLASANATVTIADDPAAIKLINAGVINTTDFITGVEMDDDPIVIASVNYDCAHFGSSTSSGIVGATGVNKFIIYDAKTTQTKIKFVLYNTNSSSQQLVLQKLVEGANATEDVVIDVPSKEYYETEYYAFNNAANRTMYVSAKSTNIKVLQVKVIDDGTALRQAGEAGYSLNLNLGRPFLASSIESTFEGLTTNPGSNYKVLNSTELQTANNISFTVASPVTMTLVSTGAKYQVSTNSAGEGDEYVAGTNEHSLTAGTWYIHSSTGSNMKFTNIAFSAPICNLAISTQPASNTNFGAGNLTATVVAASSTDGATLSYQWYNASDDSEVSGANEATLTTTTPGEYYVVVTASKAGYVDKVVQSNTIELGYRDLTIATLSALSQGGNAIALEADKYEYRVDLPEGTTDVPALAATATQAAYGATAVPTDAAAFDNYEAISTVLVTAEDGTTTQTYTVHFYVDHEILALVDVTGNMTWDFSKAQSGTTAGSNMCNEAIFANVDGINNNDDFESDNLMVTANKFKNGKLQASMIKFHTTVDGMIKVVFSNTGDKSSDRYLTVNGRKTDKGSKNENAVTYTGFVYAGDVELGVVEGDGNMLNFTSVEFKATVDYPRTVNPSNIGTLCWTNNAVLGGATLYELAGRNEYNKLVFDEVTENRLEAGKAYIFVPENGNSVIKVFNIDNVQALDEPIEVEKGFQGTFETLSTLPAPDGQGENSPLWGNHIITNNHYLYVDWTNCRLGEYRAYIKNLMDIEAPTSTPNGAPRRRLMIEDANAPAVVTGVENLDASEAPVKMIINGQLFILRGEKMYDATGRLVK